MRYLSFALLACMSPFCIAADADVMRQFGMLGRKAVDCAAPPSRSNPHVTYAAGPQGTVTRTLEMNEKSADGTFNVRNVRMVGANLLQFEETGRTGELTVTIAQFDGKFRSWHSVRADGQVLIAEGKISRSGAPTIALTPCY